MLKRVFGNRLGWKRIVERQYAQVQLDTEEFRGFITLLNTVKVSEPLFKTYGGNDICIVDDDYMWLQQFPLEKNHAVTTMFDAKGEIVQWYIDICVKNSMEEGIPFLDDLFLDIVLLPSGEMIERDADELEEAYQTGAINQALYELAWKEQRRIKTQLKNGEFPLIKLAEKHRQLLMDKWE